MREIMLVTSNPNKAREIEAILNGCAIITQALSIPEIQSFSLREIVEAKARAAYALVQKPVLVEDVAFDIAAFGGFPGPFIKFWEQNVGHDRGVALARAAGDMRATARCGVGYCDENAFLYAEGIAEGTLTERCGTEGFGFDFYFVPEGYDQTFAELGIAVKNAISHRKRGMEGMRDELHSRGLL